MLIKKNESLRLRECIRSELMSSRHLLHLHRFALMPVFCVTHANTGTSNGPNTHQHTHEYALDNAVMCFTLLASCQGDTPPERVRKQTAHNIIGIGPTCRRCMTCPVSLETSLHPITVSCTGLLSKWMEAWDWSEAIRRCYFLVMFAD